jgi:hypothetical protein
LPDHKVPKHLAWRSSAELRRRALTVIIPVPGHTPEVERLQGNRPGFQRVMGFKALPPSVALLLAEKLDRLLDDHFIPCECRAFA